MEVKVVEMKAEEVSIERRANSDFITYRPDENGRSHSMLFKIKRQNGWGMQRARHIHTGRIVVHRLCYPNVVAMETAEPRH